MISQQIDARIRETYESMLGAGMKRRLGQELMLREVARTLALAASDSEPGPERVSLINATTGVGKTVAYLLPGLIVAEQLKLPLVVATSSVALQAQLIEKDVPLVAKALGISPKVSLAVGQGRYACPVKLEDAVGEGANRSLFGEPVSPRDLPALREAYEDLVRGAWDGRMDTRPGLPAAVAARIRLGPGDCKGNDCPMFTRCAFGTDRIRLKKSDVIVTNHDLLLSSVFRGRVLPPPEDCLIVIDEGHHFPYAALNASSVEVSFAQTADSLDYLLKALPAAAEGRKDLARLVPEMAKLLADLERLSLAHLANNPVRRFPYTGVDGNFRTLVESGLSLSHELLVLAEACHESCKEFGVEVSARLLEICDRLCRYFTGMTTETAPQYPPQANWISLHGTAAKGSTSCSVPSRPLRSIWRKAKAVVITSATLKDSGRSFHFYRKFSGIGQCRELDIESPFAHEKQAKVIIPKIKAKPDTDAFYAETRPWLMAAIQQTTRGSLLLFSSKTQMAAMLAGLSPSVRQDVLVQGDAPLDELLRAHRARVAKNERSVLAGLLSFGTGLDLPGGQCELLVIPKIPFPSPDNPVDATLSEWLEANNRSPFKELSLPKAAVVLQQWVGRLIRTESDHGAVLLFDRRLAEATYGKLLLGSLPKMPIERPATPEALSISSAHPLAAVN